MRRSILACGLLLAFVGMTTAAAAAGKSGGAGDTTNGTTTTSATTAVTTKSDSARRTEARAAAYWSRHPQRAYFAPLNAHNLYLETGAELGVVGLVLLLAMLALPLREIGSRDPIRLGAACGFLAFAFHAGVDWDWEMPVVTTAALYLASVLVARESQY